MSALQKLRNRVKFFRRRLFELAGSSKYSQPSLNDLDKKLSKYLNFRDGFFIEVGANDGFTQSNTYYLEKMLGWRGVLVEAVPALYRQCLEERKRSFVYNCALVAPEYSETSVEIFYANLMTVVDGALGSTQARSQHIAEGLKIQNLKSSYQLQVPARTLESILAELPQPLKIDFFSLDVEGYEINVLRGMNLERFRPRYLLVEARDVDAVTTVLSKYYTPREQLTYHDYLYELQ